MNRVELVGRLTKKPELKYTSNNVAVCYFTLAINRPKKENEQQQADFINCVVWNKQAENLNKYQDKGNLISVEGTIRVNSYEDKEGNKRYSTEILANNIEYLSSKQKEEKKEEIVEEDPFSEFGETISTEGNFLD